MKHKHKFYPYTEDFTMDFIKWGINIYITIQLACACGATKSVRKK